MHNARQGLPVMIMENNNDQSLEYIYGINAITTLLEMNAGHRKIYEIIISDRRKQDKRIKNILQLASKKKIKIRMAGEQDFRSLAGEEKSIQNIIAGVSAYNTGDLDHYLENNIRPGSRLMILDGITDIGNFGSIIRNCRAFGFDGIILPRKRSVSLNRKVSKISAGALEGISIFMATNLTMAIKKLKTAGFWVYGTTLEKNEKVRGIADTDFVFPLALVMGSEDKGMSRIVTDNCDVLVSICLTGGMQSLNVSVASGIILHHLQEKHKGEKT